MSGCSGEAYHLRQGSLTFCGEWGEARLVAQERPQLSMRASWPELAWPCPGWPGLRVPMESLSSAGTARCLTCVNSYRSAVGLRGGVPTLIAYRSLSLLPCPTALSERAAGSWLPS